MNNTDRCTATIQDSSIIWIWDITSRDLDLIYDLTTLQKDRGGGKRKKLRAKKEREDDAIELMRKHRKNKQKRITFAFGP